jgi:predicted dehydrogenase
MIRLAFMGFHHGHIFSLLKHANENPRVRLVGACEEDPATHDQLQQNPAVALTHTSYRTMLDETGCDAVAIGDVYGKRGRLVIEALRRGIHVISDKPLCTSLAEYETIAALSHDHRLRIGLQLDLRDQGLMRRARRLVREGTIGVVHAVVVTAEHPLLKGSRPAWYFEPGAHGGTLNDIAIHAADLIPWITGRSWAMIESARAWNIRTHDTPWMKDGAQFMAVLDNGGGVLGEVSYLMPDSLGYSLPPYWRLTLFGTEGVLEVVPTRATLWLARQGDKQPVELTPDDSTPGGYLDAFVDEIEGTPRPDNLTTETVLHATRVALLLQKAADEQMTRVRI